MISTYEIPPAGVSMLSTERLPVSVLKLTERFLAKIDKLSIMGNEYMRSCLYCPFLTFSRVRSFDNTRRETIQFHTPLTLIVGYNGSGKTVRMPLVLLIDKTTD